MEVRKRISLLLAMSNLYKISEATCFLSKELCEDKWDEEWTEQYIGQLEPVPFYLLDKYDDLELEIVYLSTVDSKKPVDSVGCSSDEYFINRIMMKAQHKKTAVSFYKVDLNIENEKGALDLVAEHLKTSFSKGRFDELWIDMHGGPRDIAFIMNSIISLLKVYGIKWNKIFSVDTSNSSRIAIKDASESVKMLDFVSGMNEFINFGIGDSLRDYLGYQTDLLSAIKEISDGTRLCDPQLYISGLDHLEDEINRSQDYKDDLGYVATFIDYIKDDYKDLLCKNNRNTIDIVQRCYEKKLYQQALTFIETMMPVMFVDSGIMYFDKHKTREIDKMKEESSKQHEDTRHFFFDQCILKRNLYCKGTKKFQELSLPSDTKPEDIYAIEALKADISKLNDSFYNCYDTVQVTSPKGNLGVVEVLTKTNKPKEVGQLLTLHKAIKRCRNMVNHAKNSQYRPNPNDIVSGIEKYIYLARIVFNEESVDSKKMINPKGVTAFTFQNGESKFKGIGFINKKTGTKKEKKQKAKTSMSVQTIGISSKSKRKRLEGKLEDGRWGAVPESVLPEGTDLDSFLGKNITVQIINEGVTPIACELENMG